MRDRISGRARVGRNAACAFVLCALAACASVGVPLAAPKVSVEAIAIDGVRGSDAVVSVTLRVENPNAVDLTLQSIRFGLSVNDVALTSGTTARGETIAAGGNAMIELDTHTDMNAVLKLIALIAANRRGASIQYVLEGEAIVQNGIHLPLVRRGEFPLPGAPPPQSR